jgi:hypothetical protein
MEEVLIKITSKPNTWLADKVYFVYVSQGVADIYVTDNRGNPFSVGNSNLTIDAISQALNTADGDIFERISRLETLKPIIQREDVVLGNLKTVTMPVDNPNIIGMVQQIDSTDGDKVYYPNFTTANNGRSAIFYSVLTQLENKIVIWPRPSEV